MDPIKVDFSGKGSDRSKEIVIPPEKAVLKVILSVVLALVTGAVVYYFMLPPLNPKAIEFYYFIGIVIAAFVGFLVLLTGAYRHSEYVPYVKKKAIVPGILIVALALVVGVGYVVGCQFFRAKSYSALMPVQTDRVFSEDIEEPDFDTVPKLDTDAAKAVADKALGDLSKQGKVSQYKIYEGTAASSNYPQINYNGRPTRLAMLQYGNIIKWFTNMGDGLTGYIRIDAANEKQKYQELDDPIRYSLSDHFGRHVKRVVRFAYPTLIFDAPSFEIDDADHPYWVVPHLVKTLGLFGGRDVAGIVLVDAVTGECAYYTMDQVINEQSLRWIDRVYADDLIVEQFNYYGLYRKGFWNSILGQEGCVKSTDGSSYIAKDDDVWLYTGVTSMNADKSIVGFVLVNQRTKETYYYDGITGSTEIAAAEAARQLVAEKEGYTASFPLLLNIGGSPTYFTPIKDTNNIVQLYGMVNVEEFNKVKVTGDTIAGCLDSYLAAMKRANVTYDQSAENIVVPDEPSGDPANDPSTETPIVSGSEVTGVVTEIRSAVIGGNTTYYLRLEGDDAYYAVSAAESEQAVILNKGDVIRAEASGTGAIRQMTKLTIVTE